MSFARMLADGAAQAAQLVPLLFALNGVTPAAAHRSRSRPATSRCASTARAPKC